MNNIMAPIVSLTNRFSYRIKFILVIGLFLATIGYLSYELYEGEQFYLRHSVIVGVAAFILIVFQWVFI
jgi:hypothetical protein